ncbi:hypothetical protein SPURM210S_07377 [Streptomyces purpurascens]
MTISTPIASPTHQASHTAQKLGPSSLSVTIRRPAPTVELISMAVNAPRNTRARPSRNRARSFRNPARRSSRYPTTGAAVLPARTPSAEGVREVMDRMTKKAPRAIPGEQRSPKISRKATETPVGPRWV